VRVEVADLPDGAKAVLDFKNPGLPALSYTAVQWAASRAGVVVGEL
jgi:hypothetical protein